MNMPRKNKPAREAAHVDNSATATAVAKPETESKPSEPSRPQWIDGPPVTEEGRVIEPNDPQARNWGNPYKAIVTTADFEMGENRRFKQRVFTFKEKPTEEVLAALKQHGFTYRANEKSWTIPADADTRKLTDELAQQFCGPSQGLAR